MTSSDTIQILIQVGNGEGSEKTLAKVDALIGSIQKKSTTLGKSWGQTFTGIENNIRFVGGSMQSLGNTMTKISRPMRRLFSGTVLAAGYKFFNMMTEGISGSAERYDVFATYEKRLKALGYGEAITKKFSIGTREAMTALDNLEQSVLGLPTGLDEIVSSQQKYLAASGDVEKATKAAIAANNLFLAQGSNARDQLRGERQLRNMLAGGEMTTARWQTVLEAMPAAVKAVGDQMGYAQDEFRKMLLSGQVNANAFLDAFLEVGTSGVIADATNEMKHTFQAATANIQNAFRRMGAGIIKTFDEIFKNAYGKDTIDMIISLKDVIDQLSAGIGNWIRSNPEVFTDFIDTIKSMDWKGAVEGVGEGVKLLIGYYTEIAGFFSGIGMRNVGKYYTIMGLWGKAFTYVGGILKGIRMPAAALLTPLFRLGERNKKGGILARITGAFVGDNASEAAQTAKRAGRAPKVVNSLRKVVQNLQGVLTIAGSITIAAGTGVIAVRSFKDMIKTFGEIIELSKEIDWESGSGVFSAMIVFFGAFAGIGGLFGSAIGALSSITDFVNIAVIKGELLVGGVITLAGLFLTLNTWLFKKSMSNIQQAFAFLSETASTLAGISNDIKIFSNKELDFTTTKQQVENLASIIVPLKDLVRQTNFTKRHSRNIAETFENLRNTFKSLNLLSLELDELNSMPSILNAVDKVERLFEGLGEIYKTIGDKFYYKTNKKQAQNLTLIVEATRETLEEVDKMGKFIPEVNNTLKNTVYGTQGGEKIFNSVIDNLEKYFDGLDRLYTSIPDFYKNRLATTKQENIDSAVQAVANTLKSVMAMIDIIPQTNESLKTAFTKTKLSTTRVGDVSAIENVVQSVDAFFDKIRPLYKRIASFEDEIYADTGKYSGLSMANTTLENIQKMFGFLSGENGVITLINNLVKELPKLFENTAGGATSPLNQMKTYIRLFFDGMDAIYKTITGSEIANGDAEQAMTQMTHLVAIIGNIKDIFVKLQEMEGIQLGYSEAGTFVIADRITELIDALSASLSAEKLASLIVKGKSFKQAVDSLIETMESIGASFNEGIIAGLNFDAIIEAVTSGMDNVMRSLDKYKSQMRTKGDALGVQFITALANKVRFIRVSSLIQVDAMFGSINGLDVVASKVQGLVRNKLSRISTNTAIDVTGGRGGIPAYTSSRGGLVPSYYATGGSVFKRRGTDTIPAMLTPNEYVHRRSAVKMFGVDFMNKVNNLDVEGAMKSLYSRFGSHISNSTRSVVNNYNTINNNQKVTQNVSTNNPNFAFRRSSRFMGAI